MSLAAFLGILAIHLMAAISPGPAFVIAVRTAASEGMRSAAALAMGLGAGATLWAAAALLGLALLFEIVPGLLIALKVAGAAFLLWIALQTWRHARDPLPPAAATPPRSARSAIRLGLLTQLANPKPALFFGAVFIGLVPPDTGWPMLALLLLLILTNETLWFIAVGRLFSLPSPRAAYGRAKRHVDRAFGGMMALLAARLALT